MRVRAATLTVAGLAVAGSILAGCASGTATTGSAGGGLNTGSTGASGGTTTGPSMGGTASVAPPSQGGTPSQVAAIAASCPTNQNFATQNGPSAKVVPDALQVSWVLRCTITHKGTTSVLAAERSQGDLGPLLRALRTPSQQRQKVVCPMMAVYLPYFELVQPNGTVFVPKVPVNNCGQPQNLVVQALESLRFTELSSKPLK